MRPQSCRPGDHWYPPWPLNVELQKQQEKAAPSAKRARPFGVNFLRYFCGLTTEQTYSTAIGVLKMVENYPKLGRNHGGRPHDMLHNDGRDRSGTERADCTVCTERSWPAIVRNRPYVRVSLLHVQYSKLPWCCLSASIKGA